jgi:hypothetical protein
MSIVAIKNVLEKNQKFYFAQNINGMRGIRIGIDGITENIRNKINKKISDNDIIYVFDEISKFSHTPSWIASSDCNISVVNSGITSEGFSPTWWPHLWRCKINPLTDSQEFKDILNQIKVNEGNAGPGNITLGNVSSIINKYQEINDAIIKEAETNVPYSGYDVSKMYLKPYTTNGYPADPEGVTADNGLVTGDSESTFGSGGIASPDYTSRGWLTGDGEAPNGLPVYSGIVFPANPLVGDYSLRTDYLPNRLFRYDGRRWVKIEDNVRTTLTPGSENQTQRSLFVNDTSTFTNNSGDVAVRQSLSKALKIKADNK